MTPDGRYFVVRGRLWRMSNPSLDPDERALGERGPVWWGDDAPDRNRHVARTNVYADWFQSLAAS